ncbi:MAG: acyl-CoA-binding protein [Flavobacteriaceae bacterium]|jgi:acyl-CoA-binding protein|nr:acyl-CoA-binding protein [Flavobacteriaceae bacterium]|tara:strand:+ start:87 stop:353 length:267 start_codon:yes stop_codon:yes gene_type:complete
MKDEELNNAFLKAVKSINDHKDPFPADLLLRLYSYYKVATKDQDTPKSRTPLINAFKTNALFQAQGLTPDEAKKQYIECAKHYFLYRK